MSAPPGPSADEPAPLAPPFGASPWSSLRRWLTDPRRPVAPRPAAVTLMVADLALLAALLAATAMALLVTVVTGAVEVWGGPAVGVVVAVLLGVVAFGFAGAARGLLIGDPSASGGAIRLLYTFGIVPALVALRACGDMMLGHPGRLPLLLGALVLTVLMLVPAIVFGRGRAAERVAEYTIRTQELRGFRPNV